MNLKLRGIAVVTKTITRAVLAEEAARQTKLSKADVASVGDAMFSLMADALMAGDNVKLTAFGSLRVRERAERLGRNPRTGTEHRISPRRTVVFIPSAHLRTALDQKAESQSAKSPGSTSPIT
jgi:integration host factor subunit alpha